MGDEQGRVSCSSGIEFSHNTFRSKIRKLKIYVKINFENQCKTHSLLKQYHRTHKMNKLFGKIFEPNNKTKQKLTEMHTYMLELMGFTGKQAEQVKMVTMKVADNQRPSCPLTIMMPPIPLLLCWSYFARSSTLFVRFYGR